MAVTPMLPDGPDADDAPLGHISYGVDKLNVIRTNIAGYAGGAAIVRELVQNADDAGSTWLTFRILADRLVVQNDSVFSDKNFRDICTIAGGGKRDEAEAIGTWGTGFLSVYQLTDHPELHSNGRHLVFDPLADSLPQWPSPVVDRTEFHFPWRSHRTPIGDRLEMSAPWTPDRIANLRDAMPDEIGRVLLFLRHMRRVALYADDGDLPLFEARFDHQGEQEATTDGYRQRWTLTIQDRRGSRLSSRVEHWMVYRASLDDGYRRDGLRIKSPDVAFAYRRKLSEGDTSAAWTPDVSLPGTIYNYLPTRLDTGFTFHINGDFFPTNNRDGILSDDSDRAAWNRRVVARIARLFGENLARIRDESDQATAFYKLLPLDPEQPILEPFVEQVRLAAATVPLVKSSRGRWTLARNLRLTRNELALWQIAHEHLDHVEPRSVAGERQMGQPLTRLVSSLGERDLLTSDVLKFVKAQIPTGTPLTQANAILNTREKLNALLRYVARLESMPTQVGPLREGDDLIDRILAGAPVFLDADGCLRAWGQPGLVLADESVRRALPPELLTPDVLVADANYEHDHLLLLERRIARLGPREAVRRLIAVAGRCHGRRIDEAHPLVRGRERLRAVLDYLAERRASLVDVDLRPLALCLDEDGVLCRAAPSDPNGPWLADDATRALLRDAPGLSFAHPELSGDARYTELLVRMGVQKLTPSRMAELLGRFFPRPDYLVRAPAFARSAERLCALYRYFHQHAGALDGDTVDRLRRLPFVLTQQQRLGAIADPNAPVLLPPPAGAGEAFEDVMHRVELVADAALADGLRTFFKMTLHAQELSRLTYIEQYVIPHYNDRVLTHDARTSLLGLVRDCWRQIERERPALLDRLCKVSLIRCQDDRYRPASEVYLPSALLDGVFPHGYAAPHPTYGIAREDSDGQKAHRSARRAESPWRELFCQSGIRSTPDAADLLRSVKETVGQGAPPSEQAIRHVQQVYDLLNADWELNYRHAEKALSELATLKWLPAENRPGRWYQPFDVYPSSVRALVGDQDPVLRFRQAGGQFSHFLRLPTEPRPDSVVKHLLGSAAARQPIEATRVYQFLSRHRDDPAVRRALPQLRTQSVVFDPGEKRYWRPDQVFIGPFSTEFGPYRLYVDDPGEARQFFTALGIRDQYAVEDFAQLLRDIAAQHHHQDRPLDGRHQRLVNQAWGRLADALDDTEGAGLPSWLDDLRREAVVIDQDHHLVYPADAVINDRPDLLERFRAGAIRLATWADPGAPKLLAALGVSRLSLAVERRLVRQPAGVRRDAALSATLARLGDVFGRVIAHKRTEHPEGWISADDLGRVEVYSSDRIEIRYVVSLASGEVTTAPVSVAALLDRAGSAARLLVHRQRDSDVHVDLARELAQVINPTMHPSELIPVLSRILEAPDPVAAHRILDGFEFGREAGSRDIMVEPDVEQPTVGVSYGHHQADPDPHDLVPVETQTRQPSPAPAQHLGHDEQETGQTTVASPGAGAHDTAETPDALTVGHLQLKLGGGAGAGAADAPDDETDDLVGGASISIPGRVSRQPNGQPGPSSEVGPPGASRPEREARPNRPSGLSGVRIGGVAERDPGDEDVDPEDWSSVGSGTTEQNGQAADSSAGSGTSTDDIPRFDGEKRPRVPIIPTVWDAVRERFGATRRGQTGHGARPTEDSAAAFDADVEHRLTQRRSAGDSQSGERPTSARVTLSGQGRRQGFLPLTRALRAMLDPGARRLECRIDDRTGFPL
ncbi:MAG: DUF3684 domain-containing protein [Chloroflexi bacterium]|nr:DUF3684 domain-containing protein [Chloroflexota bacterium]